MEILLNATAAIYNQEAAEFLKQEIHVYSTEDLLSAFEALSNREDSLVELSDGVITYYSDNTKSVRYAKHFLDRIANHVVEVAALRTKPEFIAFVERHPSFMSYNEDTSIFKLKINWTHVQRTVNEFCSQEDADFIDANF